MVKENNTALFIEEDIIKPQIHDKDKKCLPCKYDIGIKLALNLCKKLEKIDINCDLLKTKYLGKEKTAKEIIDLLLSKMPEDKQETKDVIELRQLMGLGK